MENSLDERLVIDSTDPVTQLTFEGSDGINVFTPVNQPVDWNIDGDTDDPAPGETLTMNIDNGDPDDCTNTDMDSTLLGSNDWINMSLPFRQFGDSADSPLNVHPESDPFPRLFEVILAELNTTDVGIEKDDSSDMPD